MTPANDQWEGGFIRAPLHLEEAPCFVLGHRSPQMTQYVWHQAARSWRIHGDSHHPWAGELAQRLWLAVLRLYDEQGRPADGRVFYNATEIAEILGISSRSNDTRNRIALAIEQIDAIRIYVHGEPLPGPHVVPISSALAAVPTDADLGDQRSPVTLYTLFGGEGQMFLEEEDFSRQLPLFPRQGRGIPRAANSSTRTLSNYVVESLRGQAGRLIPDFVFGLPPYAIRLVRLLGKRAYDRPSITISLSALAPALPALGLDGQYLRIAKFRERLDQAHEALVDVSFLKDVVTEDSGVLTYRFGPEFSGQRRPLSQREQEVVTTLCGALERPGNAAYYRRAVRSLGPDRVMACLTDARMEGASDLAASVGRRLREAMKVAQIEQRRVRERVQNSLDSVSGNSA